MVRLFWEVCLLLDGFSCVYVVGSAEDRVVQLKDRLVHSINCGSFDCTSVSGTLGVGGTTVRCCFPSGSSLKIRVVGEGLGTFGRLAGA